MICDSCMRTKTCIVANAVRETLKWCPQYKYSRKVEIESEKSNIIKYGRNK